MRAQYLMLCLVLACGLAVEAKTVFRRGDKISDNFKQLNLPAEEIDPDVAPPKPPKVENIDTEDVTAPSGTGEEEFIEVSGDSTGAADAADETANEVDGIVPEAEAASEPAFAASSPATIAPVASSTAAPSPADTNPISKYCKCSDSHCDCCRDIGLPLLPIRGPGCAKISYLGNEKMSVSIKYGDVTLATRTISSKNTKPVCLGLPGGYNKFCGRVYGLSKTKENFKACLGFELRADDEVEAALRVSCFKFGPEGLRVAEAEPLPSEVNKDEDDEDDIFGFGAGGDDGDDDEYDDEDDEEEPDEADEADDYADEEEPEAVEEPDYGGFSLASLLDELAEDDEETAPVKPAAAGAGLTPAVVAPVSATRNVGIAQSKDDKGTEVAADAEEGSAAVEGVEEAGAAIVTPPPALNDGAATTAKTKRSKKGKKNKKKKNAIPDTEASFAYELINGILDFFN